MSLRFKSDSDTHDLRKRSADYYYYYHYYYYYYYYYHYYYYYTSTIEYYVPSRAS